MDKDSDRSALELSDASVDVMGFACLVAIMSMGKGHAAPVVTSDGALVDGLYIMGAKPVSIVTPYMRPLINMVAD